MRTNHLSQKYCAIDSDGVYLRRIETEKPEEGSHQTVGSENTFLLAKIDTIFFAVVASLLVPMPQAFWYQISYFFGGLDVATRVFQTRLYLVKNTWNVSVA